MRCGLLLVAGMVLSERAVEARQFRVVQMPNGQVFGCANCHLSAGGGGARNGFGIAVGAITGSSAAAFWSAALAGLDSDGDGFSNGFELGDPEGDGTPIPGWTVTNPGSAASKPANALPTVSLLAPAPGTVVTAPAILAVEAEASDPDGTVVKVEFFDHDVLVGAATLMPYSVMGDWGVGTHVLTARATDNLGAVAVSAPVTLTVVAPDPVQLAVPSIADGALSLSWSGGGGPFLVGQKADLAQPWPEGPLVGVTGRSLVLPLEAQAGFLRVADTAVIGPLTFTAALSGANERPNPVETSATGTGTFTLKDSTLTFEITYSGLSGAANAAHIHGPAGVEQNAPPMVDLAGFNGGAFGTSGTLAGRVILTAAQKVALLTGLTYVNLHTPQFGAGEIRGQILP